MVAQVVLVPWVWVVAAVLAPWAWEAQVALWVVLAAAAPAWAAAAAAVCLHAARPLHQAPWVHLLASAPC